MQTRLSVVVTRDGEFHNQEIFDKGNLSADQVKFLIAQTKKILKSAPVVDSGDYTVEFFGQQSDCDDRDPLDGTFAGTWSKAKSLGSIDCTLGGLTAIQLKGALEGVLMSLTHVVAKNGI